MPRTRDIMGYKLKPVFDLFTKAEIAAAKRLAKAHGAASHSVPLDPRVYGWRYLRDAKIALGGKDLGDSCPIRGDDA